MSLAQAWHFPDLVAYARMAQANLWRQKAKYKQAYDEYSVALNIARQKKIRRLEAESLSGIARWAIDLGDSEVARQKAVECLQIANEFQLGLHQTIGLIVLGKAMILAKKE